MRNRLSFLAATLVFVSTMGCPSDFELGSHTDGEKGRVSFAYRSWDDCFLGCSLDMPMMTATTERISVEPDENLANLSAESSNSSIFMVDLSHSISCCIEEGDTKRCSSATEGASCKGVLEHQYEASVSAMAPGSAYLVIRKRGGAFLDRVKLTVRDPSRLKTTCSPNPSLDSAVIVVGVGSECRLVTQAFDKGGTQLKATGGFTITTQNPEIATFGTEYWGWDDPDVLHEAFGSLKGIAPGDTTITVNTGQITNVIAVQVR